MTSPRVLFITDDHIESTSMQRTWHSFAKDPRSPLIEAEKPWEGDVVYCYGTCMVDEGQYRWYYLSVFEPQPGKSRFAVCLATSEDGIGWQKPELGAVEFAGSTANNIVMYDACIPSVLKDPNEADPQKRYKMLFWNLSGGPSGYYLALSPDGIHWERHSENPVWPGPAGGTNPNGPGDVINTFLDERSGRFVAYAKVRRKDIFGGRPAGSQGRIIVRGESENGIRWNVPEVVLHPDEQDPCDPAGRQGSTQFYGRAAFP